jgi:hypothetical protein
MVVPVFTMRQIPNVTERPATCATPLEKLANDLDVNIGNGPILTR